MDPKDKDCLRDNHLFLVNNIPTLTVADHLYATRILPLTIKEEIENQPSKTKAARLLIQALPKRGPRAFGELCIALLQAGRADIVEKLTTSQPVKGTTKHVRYRWRYIWSDDGQTVKTSPYWFFCLKDCQHIGHLEQPEYETNGPDSIMVIETRED